MGGRVTGPDQPGVVCGLVPIRAVELDRAAFRGDQERRLMVAPNADGTRGPSRAVVGEGPQARLWLVEVGGSAAFEPGAETGPLLGRLDRPCTHRLFRVGRADRGRVVGW